MKIWLSRIASVLVLAAAQTAFAGNNAAPLGVELGVASYDQVKQNLGKKTRLSDAGTNAYSDGPMLKGSGEGLEIDGLQEITFIFDKANRLAGVVMTLPKGGMGSENVKQIVGMLSKKYKVVKKDIPFVGDAYARFKQGASIIEVSAPHLGFSMEVRYLANDLVAALNTRSETEKTAKQQKQKSQF